MPYIFFKTPCPLSSMAMNEENKANTSLGFFNNKNQLSVHFSTQIKTSCSGIFLTIVELMVGLVPRVVDAI